VSPLGAQIWILRGFLQHSTSLKLGKIPLVSSLEPAALGERLCFSSGNVRVLGPHLPVRVQIGAKISPEIEGRQRCSDGCLSV